MISVNFKERLFTSVLLVLLLILTFKINLLFIYGLLVLSIFSVLEFIDMTKKIVKKIFNLFFINIIFILYITVFCIIAVIFFSHIESRIILFSIIFCCIASDIGGYVFGKIFKGPKLTKISPNKTFSGALGSIILSYFVLFFIFFLLKIEFSFRIFLISFITSIGCQIGDLFFSYLKRKAKIKDTGKILPGHGGILDRLDGILVGVPLGMIAIIQL